VVSFYTSDLRQGRGILPIGLRKWTYVRSYDRSELRAQFLLPWLHQSRPLFAERTGFTQLASPRRRASTVSERIENFAP
jgi:hypothetical protein